MLAGACSRSWMKNSTSVAGTALAIPLSMNTASRRRKVRERQGSHSASIVGDWLLRRATGTGARRQASQPASNAIKKRAVVAGRPSATGVIDAKTTPTRPSPSRQATMRLRCASLPPSIAPQDWCDTLSAL